MVYSVIGVIVLIVIVAACILLRRVLMTKKGKNYIVNCTLLTSITDITTTDIKYSVQH